ncbi:hypothetical protein Tco_0405501, partial [Tanacetum coccineum]
MSCRHGCLLRNERKDDIHLTVLWFQSTALGLLWTESNVCELEFETPSIMLLTYKLFKRKSLVQTLREDAGSVVCFGSPLVIMSHITERELRTI